MLSELKLSQKVVLGILCCLLLLMVFFSFDARKNLGEEGFNQCVQEKCTTRGQAYCEKYNELNNCCLGAGGKLTQNNQGFSCSFI